MKMMNLFEDAMKEIDETGVLSLPTRKKIWLSYGEVDHDERNLPPKLTEGLKKRVQLGKRCMEKIFIEWEKYNAKDQRPQAILYKINEYLEQKATLDEIDKIVRPFKNDVLENINSNPNAFFYLVGMILGYIAEMLHCDDPLLFQDEYPESQDEDLDFEMWDASYYAYLLYINRDDNRDIDIKIKGMEFWIWYINEATKIAGIEALNYKVDLEKKAAEYHQKFESDIEKVSLEQFVKKLSADFDYETLTHSEKGIEIKVLQFKEGACCSKCGQYSNQLKTRYSVRKKMTPIQVNGKEVEFSIVIRNGIFICNNEQCKLKSFPAKSGPIKEIDDNYNRYIADEERRKKLYALLGVN